jgi:hypothetical protein
LLIRLNGTASFLLAWTCLLAACATHTHTATVLGTPCGDAGPRLNSAWRSLNEALQTPEGCAAENGLRCEGLRTQIERLSIDCPSNPDVIMANALLAFSRRDFVRTQQLLDELFSLAVSYPEAAELRARVALEQGNARFAVRFLDQQIRLHGDHPGMRETYASALYFVGRWDEAQAQLQIAKRLGGPFVADRICGRVDCGSEGRLRSG